MFGYGPDTINVVPTRYRQVALATDLESLEPDWLWSHFVGREAYMRTRFIVARKGEGTALIEVVRSQNSDLFSPIIDLRVLADAKRCRYVHSDWADAGVPSHLAAVAAEHPGVDCVVIEGRYSHVSFILNPKPLKLYVLDIVPPFPSKLLDQVTRVLDLAENLQPVVVVPVLIDSRDELKRACHPVPKRVLVPCRGSGVEIAGSTVSYLDERPEQGDWTLLGCERSHQIHTWFYGKPPATVDICPKRFLGQINAHDGALLTRCCLLQEGIEAGDDAMFVPWGASLEEVREAIEHLVEKARISWTRT